MDLNMLNAFVHLSLMYHGVKMALPNGDSLNVNGPSQIYDNMMILVEPDIYTVYWTLNQTDITFEVHVKGK